jgi:hypothetical protein
MYWDKVTVFAVVFLVDCVGVLELDDVALVDCDAPVLTCE